MLNSTNRSKFATISQAVLAFYFLLLFTLTHLPPSAPFLPGRLIDKVLHFVAYVLLTLLIATTWQLSAGFLTARHLFWVWAAVAVWGAIDEVTQIPVRRHGSFWDWLADMAGAAVGVALFVGLRRLYEKRTPSRQ